METLVGWGIECFFGTVFMCIPIEYNWDHTVKGHCIDYGVATIANGVINIVLDVVMLIYPLPMVWKLQMSRRNKILVSLTFAAGCW
jgi:hypothetical protein